MMNFLRKHMRKIFIVTIVAFLGGTFMGGGAYLFSPSKDYDTAANVNSEKIPLKLFIALNNASANMYRNAAGQSLTPEQLEEIKVKNLQALIQDELFYQEALKYGILVSDAELKNDIHSSAMFKNKDGMFDANIYYAFLNAIKMSPKDYENMRRKQIAGEKLKLLLASTIKVSDAEYDAYAAGNPEMTKEDFLQIKGNALLNEWFNEVISRSKIVTNDNALKQF